VLRAACFVLRLAGQLRLTQGDYLVPTLQALQVKDDDWKFINLGIGANDIVGPGSHLHITWIILYQRLMVLAVCLLPCS
jgi:hypothetical protein